MEAHTTPVGQAVTVRLPDGRSVAGYVHKIGKTVAYVTFATPIEYLGKTITDGSFTFDKVAPR